MVHTNLMQEEHKGSEPKYTSNVANVSETHLETTGGV